MGVPHLINLCSSAIACQIMDQPKICDLRTYMGQDCDYTNDEIKEIEEENEALYDYLQRDEDNADNY